MQITICLWIGVGGWIINWFSIEWYYSSKLLEEISKHEEEEKEKWSFYSYILRYLFPENRTTNFSHGGHSGYSPRGGSNCVVFQLLRYGPLPSPINETERARARVHLISLDCKGWATESLRRVHFRDKMRITSVPFPRSFFPRWTLPFREHNRKFSARCHPDYSSVRGVTVTFSFIGGLPQPLYKHFDK